MSAGGPGRPREAEKSRVDSAIDWLEQRLNLTEIFSFLTHFGIVYTPVDTRLPLRAALRRIGASPLVSYARWPQVLGLLTALLFGLETVTGILLAFYYHPTADGAYDSTTAIVRDVPAGWFIHQMHHWGALLLVGVVVARVIRLFWDRLYHPPRELLWLSAVWLMWVALQLDFTGRLLPWDVHSYWSSMRGLELIGSQPVIGPLIGFVLGGRVITENVLVRSYALHIIVLPLFYLGGVWITFATMRRIGLSMQAEGGDESSRTTWHRHTLNLLILLVLLTAGLVTLATLLPFRFHGPADPYSTPANTRPPWYLLSPFPLVQLLRAPEWVAGLVLLLSGLVVPILPLWAARHPRRLSDQGLRRLGIVLLSLWAVFTVLGAFAGRR